MSSAPQSLARERLRRVALAVLADACWVLVFVVIGRANHHDGVSLAGVASTAWPFLAGLAAGEAVTRCWRHPAALIPTGLGAWLLCFGGGQVLRVVSGQGTEPGFVVVSAAFLGLFLLGWRVAAAAATNRLRASRSRLPG